MRNHCIKFIDSQHEQIEILEGVELATVLTAENSPVLFGCRSGICGTCLVEVITMGGELLPPQELESETLSLHVHDNPNARLACQIHLTTSISLRKLTSI